MDSIVLAIVLCQIYVQAVIYWMIGQILSKGVVVSLIFTNCRSFKKEAVVSGTSFFVHCGTTNTLLDVQVIANYFVLQL